MRHEFSREELFDLVWSNPIKDVAPTFGVSDVAVAKACKKAAIPLPGRGYWAKLKAGQACRRTPLPARGLGMSDTVVLGRLQWHADKVQAEQEIGPPPAFSESLEELTARVARLVGKVSQSRDLKRPHPAIAKLLSIEMLPWQESCGGLCYRCLRPSRLNCPAPAIASTSSEPMRDRPFRDMPAGVGSPKGS
jgi:hypothetical protein